MIASIMLSFGLLGWWYLIRYRRLEDEKIGFALGIALLWLLIIASRPVSLWLHASSSDVIDVDTTDGNPINRIVGLGSMAAGAIILLKRRISLREFIVGNKLLFCLLIYGLISVTWSDFSYIGFKRWFRHLGPIIFALVVLTDRRGFRSAVMLLKYAAYILLPLSIVLIKWYPALGRHYASHSGIGMLTGVTMHKNQLGMLCMICALILGTEIYREWSSGNRRGFKIKGDICLLVVAGYLLLKSHSATALLSCIAGGIFYFFLRYERVRKFANPKRFVMLLLFSLAVPIAFVGFNNVLGSIVDLTGHADTFWGRTEIWKIVIGMAPNPILGCGYDTFWLGDRLDNMWDIYWWHPTEAHNGFVEVYIQLGLVGLTILLALIISNYSRLYHSLLDGEEFAKTRLTFVAAIVLYDVAEAAFVGLSPVWFIFLLVTIYLPFARKLDDRPISELEPELVESM